MNDFIFYNKLFSTNGKIFYSRTLQLAGFWTVRDLYDDNLQNYKVPDLMNRGLNVNDILLYNRMILKAKSFKKAHSEGFIENKEKNIYVCLNNQNIELSKIKNTEIKHLFIERITARGKAEEYYSTKFGLVGEDWKYIYLLPEKLLRDNIVKETQFKILHKIIPTRKYLFIINKIESPACCFCNLYQQTICHLFFECVSVRTFWFQFQNQWKTDFDTNISVDLKDVIIGHHSEDRDQDLLILYAKHFIFMCNQRLMVPSFKNFETYLEKELQFREFSFSHSSTS